MRHARACVVIRRALDVFWARRRLAIVAIAQEKKHARACEVIQRALRDFFIRVPAGSRRSALLALEARTDRMNE